MQAIAAGAVVASFMQSAFNRWIDPDEWEDVSPWVKDNYWLMPLPSGKFAAMKVPSGYNIFIVMGNVFEESFYGSFPRH